MDVMRRKKEDNVDEEYDDEEELEEELDDEDEDDEEAEIEAEIQAQAEDARKKELQNKLKAIERRISLPLVYHLTPTEKLTMNKAKKEFPAQVAKINAKLVAKRSAKTATTAGGTIASSTAFLPAIIIVIAALFLVLTIMSILGLLNDGSSGGGAEGSEFGTPAEYVYGVRAIYEDEEEAKKAMVRTYSNIILNTVDTINRSDANYTITLSLPEGDFDYTELITNYGDVSYSLQHLSTLTYQFAKEVYADDIEGGAETDFASILNSTPYFGVSTTALNNFATTLSQYIETNQAVLVEPKNEDDTPALSGLASAVNGYFSTISTARTEKYFIQDFAAQAGKYAPGLSTSHKYKAFIYLTKKDMNVSYLSYIVNSNISGVNAYLNSQEIALTNAEEFMEGSNAWLIETSNTSLNIRATASDIAEHYISADEEYLTKGLSLYEVAQLNNNSAYLTQSSDNPDLLTYLTYGLHIKFDTTSAFTFNEYVTTVE